MKDVQTILKQMQESEKESKGTYECREKKLCKNIFHTETERKEFLIFILQCSSTRLASKSQQ